MVVNPASLDLEQQQLTIAKLQHELSAAKTPFWRSVGFWLAFAPAVAAVLALVWDIRQDHLTEEARHEKEVLAAEIRDLTLEVGTLNEQIDSRQTKYLELQTERDKAATRLKEVSGDLESVSKKLEVTRGRLSEVQNEFARLEVEAICTLGENIIENIAWLGTGLLFQAEDMIYPTGVATATEKRYPALFEELGGDAFDRRMNGYWETVWQGIPHYNAIPEVAFSTSLVVGFVEHYVSNILGTHSLVDVVSGSIPRPKPLTMNSVLNHVTKNLSKSGPAGTELASRISDYELDPSLESQSLMFTVDPAKVDLRFADSQSLRWSDVTLTEAETRILAAEVERLLDVHFHASIAVSNLASAVLMDCPTY